jgi:hypothetical protein
MFPRTFPRVLLLIVVMLPVFQTQAFAQSVCDKRCGLNPACHADCQAKLQAYYAFMTVMSRQVLMHDLPSHYVKILEPLFGVSNLSSFRFGHSVQTMTALGITDCNKAYFSNSTFVSKAANGDLTSDEDFFLLFHEMQHYVQCTNAGGRNAYALRWFGELGTTVLTTQDPFAIHDAMPMEGDADMVANSVLTAIRPFQEANGSLRRPSTGTANTGSGTNSSAIEVTRSQIPVPSNNQITVERNSVQNFYASTPRFEHDVPFKWEVAEPNRVFSPASGMGPRNYRFVWAPTAAGAYRIRITAGTFGTEEYAQRIVNVSVTAPNQGGSSQAGSGSTQAPQGFIYETINGVPATMGVQLIVSVSSPVTPVTICVSNPVNGLLYYRAQGSGSALFRVPKNKSVTVVVSGGGTQSGVRGQSFSEDIGTQQKTRLVNLVSGSGGPHCGGIS